MKVDKDSFTKIVDENKAIINKICYGYASNFEDRLDLKQEILIQLWKAFPSFNHKSQISTWIYRVALNTAISNYRRNKRKISECEFSQNYYQIPEDDNNYRDENVAKLYQLIYQLNDFEKAIMLLYLDDQPYKRIAEIMGISETNVATKISRIKSKLKNKINKN